MSGGVQVGSRLKLVEELPSGYMVRLRVGEVYEVKEMLRHGARVTTLVLTGSSGIVAVPSAFVREGRFESA